MASWKGHQYQAFLDENGHLVLDGQIYVTLDEAMTQVLGNRQCFDSNGWQFWSWYNTERGTWTPLEHARAKLEHIGAHGQIKTSITHPLRIDFVSPVDSEGKACEGRIGMTFCPGKKGEGIYGGIWNRSLPDDLEQIRRWGSHTLISLMEAHEFAIVGVPEFLTVLPSTHLHWLHFPVRDMQTPDQDFERLWNPQKKDIFNSLHSGKDIVIHCRGGLGRTGLLAARILVEMGEEPAKAVRRVRAARKHAIETFTQEEYVLEKKWEQY